MKWTKMFLVVGLLSFAGSAMAAGAGDYEAEKAKALKNPYANDLGPDTVDVTSYPADLQKTYKDIFLPKCARCHSAARPLNSQFVEPAGPKEQGQSKVAQWKSANPEIFQDKLVWQIEAKNGAQPGIWERYVKKMMAKPGCNIKPDEGKKIWEFLRYDSEKRKTGPNAAAWASQRRKLLADFKAKYPDRYKELYETR